MKMNIFPLIVSVFFLASCGSSGSATSSVSTSNSKPDSLAIVEKFMANKLKELERILNVSDVKTSGIKLDDKYLNLVPGMVGQLIVLDTVETNKIRMRTLPLYILKSNDFISTEMLIKTPEINVYTSAGQAGGISAYSAVSGNFSNNSTIGITYKTIYSCAAKNGYASLAILDTLNSYYGLKAKYGNNLKIVNSVAVKEFEFVKMDSLSADAQGNFSVVNVNGKMFFKQESGYRVRDIIVTYDEPLYRVNQSTDNKNKSGNSILQITKGKYQGIIKIDKVEMVDLGEFQPIIK